jgi:hypothetical protein
MSLGGSPMKWGEKWRGELPSPFFAGGGKPRVEPTIEEQ